jgi:hypothetical protein
VVLHVLPSGERFPVLVDRSTGCPYHFPVLFVFGSRAHGGAGRLVAMLRRVGDLYDWCLNNDITDPDLFFRNQRWSSFAFMARAIRHIEALEAEAQRSLPKPGDGLNRPTPEARPRLRNGRCAAWESFVLFILIQDNWSPQPQYPISRGELRDAKVALHEFFRGLRQPVPASTPHKPLTPRELESIEAVLARKGRQSPFALQTIDRNRVLYGTIRWGGVRIGEALKVKTQDLPPLETSSEKLVRELKHKARSLMIQRRPDDPEDPRVWEVRVKRGNRLVALPDELIESTLLYAASRNHGTQAEGGDYLLQRTGNVARPLSQSRAEAIVKQLGAAAAREFEDRYPGESHSLRNLSWHRFRTTRACELVPAFFGDAEVTETRKRAFCDYFGWADLSSAGPYIGSLLRERGQEVLDRDDRLRKTKLMGTP